MAVGACCLVAFLLIHCADQASDVMTAMVFFAQGLTLEGCATLSFVFVPGFVVFILELREAMLGRGQFFRGLLYMLLYPVYTWIVILYSLYHLDWRDKAMFLVVLEGFLSGSPQLILQLSLWFKGILTGPARSVLANMGDVLDEEIKSGAVNQTQDFQFLGREYDSEVSPVFGWIQVSSIFISFTSVLASGIFFNEIENGVESGTFYRTFIGIPFFILTVIYRSASIALVICFLKWWSSVIIFLFFFLTVLVSVCGGDRFNRAFMYGLWSQLIPVGFSRDPVESIGYKIYRQYYLADTNETKSSTDLLKQRAKFFVNLHLMISSVLLLPCLVASTVLFNQAKVYSWMDVNTRFIFRPWILNMIIVPGLGVILAFSILLGRFYLTSVYNNFKRIQL